MCVCTPDDPPPTTITATTTAKQPHSPESSEHRYVTTQGQAFREGLKCDWTAPSAADVDDAGGAMPPQLGVVMCAEGYQLSGALAGGLHLSDGRALISGGRCVRVAPAGKR